MLRYESGGRLEEDELIQGRGRGKKGVRGLV